MAKIGRTICFNAQIGIAELILVKKLSDGVDTFVISSPGGQVISAVDISEIIIEKDWNVVIDGKCLSACASFILLADKDVRLTDNAKIGVHSRLGIDRIEEHLCKRGENTKSCELYRGSKTETAVRKFRDFAKLRPNSRKILAKYENVVGVNDNKAIEFYENGGEPTDIWLYLSIKDLSELGVSNVDTNYTIKDIVPYCGYKAGGRMHLVSDCEEVRDTSSN